LDGVNRNLAIGCLVEAAAVAVTACSGPGAPLVGPPGAPDRIRVVTGDAQIGEAGMALAVDPVVQLVDVLNRPVPGVELTFTISAPDGAVSPGSGRTGANGALTVHWTLGGGAGLQHLQVNCCETIGATLSATAVRTPNPGHLDQVEVLSLATYDGSGQAVHPDIAFRPGGTRPLWLAITPYPGGNATDENPSLFQGADGLAWNVPVGVTNPIAHPDAGYLSDPDIVFDPSSSQLFLYYRQVASGHNIIRLTRSDDGIAWRPPQVVASASDHQIVSPTVVRGGPGAPWIMWSVDAGTAGCTARATKVEARTSSDGIHWKGPITTDLQQPGEVVWHIDVEWVPARDEYWALYNTYPPGSSCVTGALYLARSDDGIHWRTAASPLARRGLVPAFADVIYRSTFLVDASATTVTFWFSGATYQVNTGYIWSAAVETRRVADVLAQIASPSAAVAAPLRALPPPEPDLGGAGSL
jgi:hypothetical protein